MNYIKQLQERNKILEDGLVEGMQRVRALIDYAKSPKFYENEYIHKNDIILRGEEIWDFFDKV